MEGENNKEIQTIVNRIVDNFVKDELSRKTADVNKSVAFLEDQKNTLKKQMEGAEDTLNKYRQKKGAVDLSKETQFIMERMVIAETELSKLRRKRAELLEKFTPQHSNVMALDAQMSALYKELGTLENKVKTFPDTQQEVLRLSRDTELYTQLYTFLNNRIEQLRVMKAGPIGTVRVIDHAELPYLPIKPVKPVVMVISLALGLSLGIGVAFIRKALRGAIQDPDIIEKRLGLHVYATVPHSEKQPKPEKDNGETTPTPSILAIAEPADPSIESLRSLRTSFHFALLEAKNNVILLTGPTPEIGKSFLSLNFAAVLASSGKRVLLIDGDLRKGHIHEQVGLENTQGLSDAVANGRKIEKVVQKSSIDGLDIITTGTKPPNPSELLLHERFASAIEKLSQQYDYVLIDSPPILLVTDAAIIGQLAGAALLVVKSGEHTLREIETSVKRLKQGGVNLRGVIFNDMPVSSRRYGYGNYYGYAHTYRYEARTNPE